MRAMSPAPNEREVVLRALVAPVGATAKDLLRRAWSRASATCGARRCDGGYRDRATRAFLEHGAPGCDARAETTSGIQGCCRLCPGASADQRSTSGDVKGVPCGTSDDVSSIRSRYMFRQRTWPAADACCSRMAPPEASRLNLPSTTSVTTSPSEAPSDAGTVVGHHVRASRAL